jgi:hypothetical protein
LQLALNAGLSGTGTDNTVVASYTDKSSTMWQTQTTGTMTVTSYGQPGQAIDGTFAVTVAPTGTDAGAALSLSGSFHVCHRPDLIAP